MLWSQLIDAALDFCRLILLMSEGGHVKGCEPYIQAVGSLGGLRLTQKTGVTFCTSSYPFNQFKACHARIVSLSA